MKVLSDKIHSTVRNGSWIYAIIESYQLGLSTVRLGANGEGARLTNLFTVGIPSVGDMVIVDFSASRPYVRTLILDPEEEPEEPLIPVTMKQALWKRICQHQSSFMATSFNCPLAINENTGYIAIPMWAYEKEAGYYLWISTDGGNNWGAQPIYTDMDMNTIQWLNNGVLLYNHDAYCYHSNDCGNTWMSNPISGIAWYDQYAFAKDTGTLYYRDGNNHLLRSYDYGKTYSVMYTFSSYTDQLRTSYNGSTVALTKSDDNGIMVSFDGGVTFQHSNPPGWLTYAHDIFVSPDGTYVGVYCNDASPEGFYVTHNGIDWTFAAPIECTSITYDKTTNTTFVSGHLSAEHGTYYYGGYDYQAWKSTDGYSWERVSLPQETAAYEGWLGFYNGTLFIRYDYHEATYKSTNLGVSWEAIDLQADEIFDDIIPYCISGDGQFIFASSINTSVISRDGGETWGNQFIIDMSNVGMYDYYGQLYRAACSHNGQHVVFFDYVGQIYVSHDWMKSWKPIDYETHMYFASSQGYRATASVSDDGSVMAIGGERAGSSSGNGYLYLSFSYGETWITLDFHDEINTALAWVSVSNDGSTIWFNGYNYIGKITNNGATIESISLPPGCTDWLYQIKTNGDGSIAVINDHNERMFRYENGEWSKIYEGEICSEDGFSNFALDVTGKMIAMNVKDANLGEYRMALTWDGGEHWELELHDALIDPYSLECCAVDCGDDFSSLFAFADQYGYIYKRIG